ncbi:MAG TPA: ATPase domain-containing protein [Ktedonobacterales bacterium]|nr:ATPase domain-containing protein [Ktedonobacterales bacterium]
MSEAQNDTKTLHAESALSVTQRDPTGVAHLDDILGGGLPRGSLTLVMGLPGSGKTTLASQMAFTAARAGRTVLILTALSEPTSKLIEHLHAFTFFDQELIGGPVQFLSLQSVLVEGLNAVGNLILAEARRSHAGLVLLDGFRGMRSVDADPQAAREFLYSTGTMLNALGATFVVTSETDPRDPTFFPETTTADVILGLHYAIHGVRQYRGIEVIKARAVAPLPGMHALTLGADGATVYPQLEERVASTFVGANAQTQGAAQIGARHPRRPVTGGVIERAAFDLEEFDRMLSGGIPRSTCTLLAGSLGTGKTLLSMYFALAGIRAGERVVYLGFRESGEQLLQAAAPFRIGEELARAMQPGGLFTFIETPPIKINADILADHLFNVLDQTGAQRLVIDSIAELERAIVRGLDPQRLEDFLAALLISMRSRHVTGLLLKETDKVIAATLDFSSDALSVLAENVLLLQQVPFDGRLHRILSIPKMRFSDHDTTLREFRISPTAGIEVLQAFRSDLGVLEGIAQQQEDQSNDANAGQYQRRRSRAKERKRDD